MRNQTDSELVANHIQKLEKPFAEMVEKVRQIILNSNQEIGEQIKWNSPSFYFTGEMKPFDPKEYKRDIVVMNLRKNKILLIFPNGAKITDPTGILEGVYKDGRRMVSFSDTADIESRASDLQFVINEWLKLVEK